MKEFEPTELESEKLLLCLVEDKVAQRTGPSFEAVNEGVAIRHFKQMMLKTNAREDYRLVKVGMRQGRRFVACEPWVVILEGSEVKE